VTKAQNAEVKAFAAKLVSDHAATSEELKKLVKSRNAEWKDDDPKFREKKQKHESLQELTGAAFDKEYLEHRDLRARLFK
jgi:putative membrane protein